MKKQKYRLMKYLMVFFFLLSFNIHAKWSYKEKEAMRKGCMLSASSNNRDSIKSEKFCNCYTSHFTDHFTYTYAVKLMKNEELESNKKFIKITNFCKNKAGY